MGSLTVRHLTTYRYSKPVTFGAHRMMLRPRDSHDMRILSTKLAITPAPVSIRWLHDVFENSVAVASFGAAAAELKIESEIQLEHFESTEPDYPIEEYAATYPFSYSAEEVADLMRSIERNYPDPDHEVDTLGQKLPQSQWTNPNAGAARSDDRVRQGARTSSTSHATSRACKVRWIRSSCAAAVAATSRCS